METFKGAQKQLKYRGIRRRPWGSSWPKYATPGETARPWLGTFEKSEEAARAYDRAAYALRGHQAILNFPNDGHYRNDGVVRRSTTPSQQVYASSSSFGGVGDHMAGSFGGRNEQVIEFEYFDNDLLEDLLGTKL